jgi:peptidyl-prolyl cis-trans isomerase SurA
MGQPAAKVVAAALENRVPAALAFTMASMYQVAENLKSAAQPVAQTMTPRLLRKIASFALGTILAGGLVAGLLAGNPLARAQANEPASPYGGVVAEGIIARVNDQIITRSDYERAMADMDQVGRQHQETMQEISAAHKDLLRDLIDQQLWLSKGKELSITGETELIKKLDEIRKQYNLETIDDLEKAAREQGVSFEDFKANIRNQIITQAVMRQEVGEHIQMTPGEVERYYEAHKQDYAQPESERLGEILISTGGGDDPAKVAAAKAKADDIEARLHAGGDFSQLAKSFSDGPTASEGGDLGQYKRGQLGKLLEDQTFNLNSGQYTDPILTRQGYIILKVVQHIPGGPRPFKDVTQDVEEAYYMSRMEPAIRDYLSKMRDEAFILINPGYTDSGATYGELHPSIAFSAYVPPAPKKKAKVERTRFRESTRTFRQKSGAAPAAPAADESAEPATTPATTPAATPASTKKGKKGEQGTEKPGKREKIRYGQAPRATLPTASTNSSTENAGALPLETASVAEQPANPLEPTAPTKKTRYSARAREPKKLKGSGAPGDALAPAPPDAAEVADRQTQSAPLGLSGTTPQSKKKKKASETTAEKTRMSQQKKNQTDNGPKPVQQPTPIPPVPGAPAPAPAQVAPAPQPAQQPQQ